MSSRTKTTATLVAVFAAIYLATTNLWALEGSVVDEGTNKPIPGAFVVATWIGSLEMPVHASSGCYHIEFTRSDDSGKFRVSEFSGNINPLRSDRRRHLNAYSPGYNVSANTPSDEGRFLMVRRVGTKEEQFDQIQVPSTQDCVRPNDRRLLPMYKALYRESASNAVTRKQKERVIEGVLRDIEAIELGQQEANKNADLRISGKNVPEELK